MWYVLRGTTNMKRCIKYTIDFEFRGSVKMFRTTYRYRFENELYVRPLSFWGFWNSFCWYVLPELQYQQDFETIQLLKRVRNAFQCRVNAIRVFETFPKIFLTSEHILLSETFLIKMFQLRHISGTVYWESQHKNGMQTSVRCMGNTMKEYLSRV